MALPPRNDPLHRLHTWLEAQSIAFRMIAAYVAALLLSTVDVWTGYEVSFSVFYLLPVFYVAYSLGKRSALFISAFSAALWFGADVLAGATYSHSWIPLWNAIVRLGFFATLSILVSKLREAWAREKG